MTPLVLGSPEHGGLEAFRLITDATGGPVTLAWSDRPALEACVPEVVAAGGSTLLVDTAHPGAGQAAIAHQLQVMGTPQFIVVALTDDAPAASLPLLVDTALSGLPPAAVVVVGPAEVAATVAGVAESRELAAPLLIAMDELGSVAATLAAAAQWDTA